MKQQILRRQIAKALTVAALALGAGLTAHAQVIDNFSVNDLANYNTTIVLAQSADPAATFGTASSPAGTLQVSQSSWSAGAQQQVFLRNDGWSLGVGDVLRADISGVAPVSGFNADFGIALMYSASPVAAVWPGSGTADVRTNMVTVYLKENNSDFGYSFRNAVNGNAGSSSGTASSAYSTATGLWISHPASDTYSVGYSVGSVDTVLSTVSGLDPSIGNALGFYSDVRGNGTFGYLDNLRLEPIPEPSSLALCGLGLAGLITWKRRKK